MMACFLVGDLPVSGKWQWGNAWALSKANGWSKRNEVGMTPKPGCAGHALAKIHTCGIWCAGACWVLLARIAPVRPGEPLLSPP